LVLFTVAKDQAKSTPRATNVKAENFWTVGIIIISCFMGRIHVRAEPEITDIEARVSMGDVRELLSSN
jgi:hypothetical protein